MSPKRECPRCGRIFDYEGEFAMHTGALGHGLVWQIVKFGRDHYGRVQEMDPSRKSCAVAILASWGEACVRQPEDLEILEGKDLPETIVQAQDRLYSHQHAGEVEHNLPPCPRGCPECRRRKADLKFLKDEVKKAKVRFLKKAKIMKKIADRRRKS